MYAYYWDECLDGIALLLRCQRNKEKRKTPEWSSQDEMMDIIAVAHDQGEFLHVEGILDGDIEPYEG